MKFTVLLTPVNWMWLSTLKMSSRTSNFIRLPTGKIFEIDRSRLLIGGSRAKNRGDSLPLLPGCGGAKHDVLAICLYGSLLVADARIAGQDDARVRIAVGAGQVRGADAGDRVADRVRPAARPAVDARELPVVDQVRRALAARRPSGVW